MAQTYDIAVLGATPAGLAAAGLLARKRRKVIVIDSPSEGVDCPLADWAPSVFFSRTHLPRSVASKCGARAFKRLRYHNAALDKQVEHSSRSRAGYFVQTDALISAMIATAKAGGVTIQKTRKPPAIQLMEDLVQIRAARPVRSKLLLVAQGRPEQVLEDLGITIRNAPRGRLTVAALDVPIAARSKTQVGDGVLNVVEMTERSELGIFFRADALTHLRVISYSAAAGSRIAELSEMAGKLQGAGLVPQSLLLGKARGAVWRPPAGVALEMETHVAKRCLLTGTAGGFADSITGQILAPSVRSALLAANVASQAIASGNPQEALGKYHDTWQEQLAASLRPPSTPLQMLLPLLFVNQRIAERFSQALLYGENM